jgi:hypothetical protein
MVGTTTGVDGLLPRSGPQLVDLSVVSSVGAPTSAVDRGPSRSERAPYTSLRREAVPCTAPVGRLCDVDASTCIGRSTRDGRAVVTAAATSEDKASHVRGAPSQSEGLSIITAAEPSAVGSRAIRARVAASPPRSASCSGPTRGSRPASPPLVRDPDPDVISEQLRLSTAAWRLDVDRLGAAVRAHGGGVPLVERWGSARRVLA